MVRSFRLASCYRECAVRDYGDALGEREARTARTQGAPVSGKYGRSRGRRRAPLRSRQSAPYSPDGALVLAPVLTIEIPGRHVVELEQLVLDLNGTLANRGELVEGVAERIARISSTLTVRALSADTFGALAAVAAELGAATTAIETGADKERIIRELGAERCVAIGNGANDRRMLAAAAIGIAVLGPEGAFGKAVSAADVVCGSIIEALDLLSTRIR